jgi:hypothetical protein
MLKQVEYLQMGLSENNPSGSGELDVCLTLPIDTF